MQARSARVQQPGEEGPLHIQEGPQADLNRLTIRAATTPVEEKRGRAVRKLRMEIIGRNAGIEKICSPVMGLPEVRTPEPSRRRSPSICPSAARAYS